MAGSNAAPHAHVAHRQASARGQQRIKHLSQHLTVLSANVRGLRTNLGDLTHNFVLRHQADIVANTETWLNGEVEAIFGNIPGYTKWVRKNREQRVGGKVAACFKHGLQSQLIDIMLPQGMEAIFFRVVLSDKTGLLLQGRSALDFLTEKVDTLLQQHRCSHVMILGDLNHHLEQDAFTSLLTVQGLANHMTFPTHERGGSLDPVLTDLPDSSILCQQLG
ncbi:hypothetical protein E2C01_062182 [Portunus trituberculatus]|uniref:Endonuclease/exonuclease/phosphatase domain-containing protein n=1 Tax=Portunus trituberculatus TaxID=210409 RepID=A0A5B7HCX8_PORTR|nr:hypothetical protein [Portunus trituberculatus]